LRLLRVFKFSLVQGNVRSGETNKHLGRRMLEKTAMKKWQ